MYTLSVKSFLYRFTDIKVVFMIIPTEKNDIL